MEYTFLILTTRNGSKYARSIGKAIFKLGHHYKLAGVDNFIPVLAKCPAEQTVVHSRVAYPFITASKWLAEIVACKNPVINSPKTLMLTSNKLQCNRMLRDAGLDAVPSLPLTQFTNNLPAKESFIKMMGMFNGRVIIKPIVSSGGKNVFRFSDDEYLDYTYFWENYQHKEFFVQPYINVVAMRRVIVINSQAMHMGFEDTRLPDDEKWKLSVCINPEITISPLSVKEKSLAERVQNIVGGTINFIDLMSSDQGKVFVSEVNTSCNLSRHDKLVGGNIAVAIAQCLIERAGRLL